MYKYLRIETKMVRKRICWLSSIWKLVIGVANARQKLPLVNLYHPILVAFELFS